MAATISTTMAMLNTKCMTSFKPSKPNKSIHLLTGTANIAEGINQINMMRTKGVIVGLGIGGGLAASFGLFTTPEAAAGEIVAVAEAAAAAANDNRGQLLLIVIAPAILWVLYNILQPALNQINKMRS